MTVNQLFEAYQKEIDRTSTRDGFYYLLKRYGWRTVTPRPKYPKKADAQTIETSNTQLFSKSNLVHCLLTVDFKTLFSSP